MPDFVCITCEKHASGYRSRKYCDACKQEKNRVAARERYRAADPYGKKATRRLDKERRFRERGNHWTAHRKEPKTFTCTKCGSPFQSFQAKAKLCKNPKCLSEITVEGAKKAARNRKRKFPSKADRHRFYLYKRRAIVAQQKAERFAADEVFQRDNWTCGICGFAVDSELKYPHSYSASLDHIVPVSSGGSHTRDNVQCSHWICNMRKGKIRVRASP